MFTRLIESLSATEALSQVFSDGSVLQAMLDFEAALARAEARVGLIPADAAAAITAAAIAEGFDSSELARQSLRAGTPAIPAGSYADRQSARPRRGRRGLRALGRHQPGRDRQRPRAAARPLPAGDGGGPPPRIARAAPAIQPTRRHRDARAHPLAARPTHHFRAQSGGLAGRHPSRLVARGQPLRRGRLPAVRRRQRDPGRIGRPRARRE